MQDLAAGCVSILLFAFMLSCVAGMLGVIIRILYGQRCLSNDAPIKP